MPSLNVVALNPFVAVVDVTIELFLVVMNITLCFGPFNTKNEAEEWCDIFLVERKILEKSEAQVDEVNDELVNFLTEPYLRTYTGNPDIMQPKSGGRDKGALIPPKDPMTDAREIHTYALMWLEEAITDTFRHLHETIKK